MMSVVMPIKDGLPTNSKVFLPQFMIMQGM